MRGINTRLRKSADPIQSHHLFNLTLEDRLFLAPATKFDHVMDVGTGTGLWALWDYLNTEL